MAAADEQSLLLTYVLHAIIAIIAIIAVPVSVPGEGFAARLQSDGAHAAAMSRNLMEDRIRYAPGDRRGMGVRGVSEWNGYRMRLGGAIAGLRVNGLEGAESEFEI